MKTDGFVSIATSGQGTQFAEAYGLLLASVLLGGNGKPPAVVAVTAPQAGSGASTTTLNLALMMARTGRPTAIVDANMRHPELHKAFGLPQTPGLADVLTGKAEFKSVVAATGVPNLSLIPAGHVEVPAQALLSQEGLKDVFAILHGRFDLAVIDTPSILQYPDALHIGKYADGVLVVVSSEGSLRRDQQEIRRLLDIVGAHVLGTVLNRVRPRGRDLTARVP